MVPMGSPSKDAEAKAVRVIPGKAAIYVIRSAEYASELHFVTIDRDERVALAAKTYAVFSVNPGERTLTFDSAVNREKLKLITELGKDYFIEMGYGWAGGMGHVTVVPGVLSESEGKQLLVRAALVLSGD